MTDIKKFQKTKTCCLCGVIFIGWGNNPAPCFISDKATCCDECNMRHVIPARLQILSWTKSLEGEQ